MSSPTINSAATQGIARVVDNLDHQVIERPARVGPPELNEVTELAERMRTFAGPEFEPVIERFWDARNAIDQTAADIDRHTAPTDLLDLTADEVAERFIDAAQTQAAKMLDSAGYSPARRTQDMFTLALASSACQALKPAADAVVTNLRPDFDKHVKVITAAHKVGITKDTNPTELLETGTKEQIAAYRNLAAAVAGLDQIADLRNTMTDVLNYGPRDPDVAAFVTGLTERLELQSAWNRYEDPTEVMQYNQNFAGSALVNTRVRRLGGRWLDMVNAGYALRLNTADEAASMIAAMPNRWNG